MPVEDELFDLSDFFKVLGDSTRVKIMWALDESEMCVCDLAVLLNMTKSAISHQLKLLRTANLVKYRKEGKVVFYSLSDNHVKDILEKGLEHIRNNRSRNFMMKHNEPDFNTLENHIIDVIKEEQIKLGYRSETNSL